MTSLDKARFDAPHETRPFAAHGHVDVITLGDFTLGRGVFEPGWKWSEDVKPIAGTDTCQARHAGICLSGSMTVRADDGTEVTYGPGDVFLMAPSHDAWTVGSEACVLYDTGVAAYAKPADPPPPRRVIRRVPLQHARGAGTAARISAALWVVAVGVLATSRGFQNGMSANLLWIVPVLVAVVAFGVAVVGILQGTGGLRGWWTSLTLTIVMLGLVLACIGTWAWPLWGLLLAAASLLTVMRLTSSRFDTRGTRHAADWLLVAAWPTGVALAILLGQLHVGPLDEDGDYPVSTGLGFGVGALLFAASLVVLGRRLHGDESAGIRTDAASGATGLTPSPYGT